MNYTPSTIEKERRNRIMVSVYAYAYEYQNTSLISDHEFDRMCFSIDTKIKTGNSKLDNFFMKEFTPSTGMWIRKHPDLAGISRIYRLILDNHQKGNA